MICLTNKFFKNEMLSQEMFGAQSGLQKQNILSTAGRPAPPYVRTRCLSAFSTHLPSIVTNA